MSQTRCVILFACLGIGMFTVPICITQIIERTKTVNQSSTLTTSGSFFANDKCGTQVSLEYKKTSLFETDFARLMSDVWEPIARSAYTPVEMQFLKAFPGVVINENYFKSFEPLFKNGVEKVDWNLAQQTMEVLLKSHFIFDISVFNEEIKRKFAQDICLFVSVKDTTTQKTLGFITFLMRASYASGDVKIMSFAVDPAAQNRGLGKVLMSSIFKIVPATQRIFLGTRVTNDIAIRAYQSWGFAKDLNPILDHPFNMNHWSFLEYKTEASNTLQNVAQSLIK